MASAEPQSASAARPALSLPLKAALTAVTLIGIVAVVYVTLSALAIPAQAAGLAGLNRGSMAKLQVLPQPTPAAEVPFVTDGGKVLRLSDFKGHPLVVNFWATWCAPCVKEMPTLAALQREEAARGVKVLPISVNSAAESEKAKAFIAGHAPLGFYQDVKLGFVTSMKPQLLGFPTTVLIDRSGMVRAVYSGDTDWSSPEARAAVERLAAS